jgi:hypothetical protein
MPDERDLSFFNTLLACAGWLLDHQVRRPYS